MVLSSAKLQIFVFSMKRKRSLIIRSLNKRSLNNNRSKIEPCGTPLTISYQSLYEEPIFVLCFRCDR